MFFMLFSIKKYPDCCLTSQISVSHCVAKYACSPPSKAFGRKSPQYTLRNSQVFWSMSRSTAVVLGGRYLYPKVQAPMAQETQYSPSLAPPGRSASVDGFADMSSPRTTASSKLGLEDGHRHALWYNEPVEEDESVPDTSANSSPGSCLHLSTSNTNESSPEELGGASKPSMASQIIIDDTVAEQPQRTTRPVGCAGEAPIPGWHGFFTVLGLGLSSSDLYQCSQVQIQLREAFDY